ncbi:unnamed protein product [Rotaria sordida]|uniref:Uncharacterized protein n=1 Tax=Rotaria sordida TaxID=392033 RepID=A0A819DQ89_9BILA|nr:unnamed protein product [Rotaria sordida]CAF1191350.1 unnamed protein product [Rotaria sordida]CAF1478453.1 unnamed protein product [Rotaria sordida]CAF3828615.1 unnamed protein product [Rotaria sordida]
MHFYCQCLNVTIDVLEINDNQETQTHILANDLIRFVNLPHEWFECNISSDLRIRIAWQSLFQSISIRDMKLNRCLVCNQYTHITNNDTNKMLINKDLLNDITVKDIYLDSNYSKITKIVLPTRINGLPMTNFLGSQDETFQRECELVRQLYRQSIDDADRETEEKIRLYQHEQEQILDTKTEAIYKELDTFLSVMRAIPRYASSTKTSPILQPSNSYISENSMESGFGSDIFDANGTDLSRQSSTTERTFSERISNLDDEIIDDPMFDNTGWFSGRDNSSNYSTSLPQDIAFRPYTIPQPNNDDSNDLERIGKSFRELSQSLMCTDGTEVFGDLPSPRLNARQT